MKNTKLLSDDKVLNSFFARKSESLLRTEFILNMYTLIGFLVAVTGIFQLIVNMLDIEINPEAKIAILTSFSGFLIAIASRAFLVFIRTRSEIRDEKNRSYEDIIKLLDMWTDFEDITKKKLFKIGKTRSYPLSIAIEELGKKHKLDTHEIDSINKALRIRNAAAHGVRPSSREVRFATDSLERAIKKLSTPVGIKK